MVHIIKVGRCLAFVNKTWADSLGGSWYTGNCCATNAREAYGKSKSRYNIPLGASIFFSRNKKTCSTCGSHPGHVGIYVGNNEIVHCYTKGKIMKHSIDEIINHGYTYAGWGYPSNKVFEAPTTQPVKSPLPAKPENSKLSINLDKLPTDIIYGNRFGLHGKITSNFPITSVTGLVRCNGTTLCSTLDEPNSLSFDIKSSNLNNKIEFSELPVGNYVLFIKATDSTTKTRTITQNFTVTPQKSSLSINLTSKLDKTNNIHTEGNRLGLYGTITSNYNIKSVSGVVQRITSRNSNGTICVDQILDTAFNCNTKTKKININKSNLNYDLTFADLKPGDYVLQIRATDSSDNSVNLVKNFKVVANQGIVTGTVVNLDKLGWKTVSIRKGASTNYKIIGDMTTGTKCKVDLDKSTTNWYYIEYNGIKGYASKKGISI